MNLEHHKNFSLQDIEGEIWKDIEDIENYMVSNFGRIKSFYTKKQKILKPGNSLKSTCVTIQLKINKQTTRFALGRLVFKTFYPNINMNKKIINHIDKDLFNNQLSNLELIDEDLCGNFKDRSKFKRNFIGVYKDNRGNKSFQMRIKINNKRIIKYYRTELEAAKAYDYYIIKNNSKRKTNF